MLENVGTSTVRLHKSDGILSRIQVIYMDVAPLMTLLFGW